jgi:hypothetical protein
MNKDNYRIMIFSPRAQDRYDIENVLRDYLGKDLLKNIEIKSYSRFNEPPLEEQIGHYRNTLAVILDRQISPQATSIEEGRRRYNGGVKASFELSKKICYERHIPYIVYRGEIVREDRKEILKRKMKLLKKIIKERLKEI